MSYLCLPKAISQSHKLCASFMHQMKHILLPPLPSSTIAENTSIIKNQRNYQVLNKTKIKYLEN